MYRTLIELLMPAHVSDVQSGQQLMRSGVDIASAEDGYGISEVIRWLVHKE